MTADLMETPMTVSNNRAIPRCRQRGQAMTEYVIIAAALVTLLFVATPVGRLLTDAIRGFYSYLTFFISLP